MGPYSILMTENDDVKLELTIPSRMYAILAEFANRYEHESPQELIDSWLRQRIAQELRKLRAKLAQKPKLVLENQTEVDREELQPCLSQILAAVQVEDVLITDRSTLCDFSRGKITCEAIAKELEVEINPYKHDESHYLVAVAEQLLAKDNPH